MQWDAATWWLALPNKVDTVHCDPFVLSPFLISDSTEADKKKKKNFFSWCIHSLSSFSLSLQQILERV